MKWKKILALLALTILSGCSEYALTGTDKDFEPLTAPDIVVTPAYINFGNVNAADTGFDEIITIKNTGSDDLELEEMGLITSSETFTLTFPQDMTVLRDESVEIIVTYDPLTYSSDSNSVYIISNDPDTVRIEVPLVGDGDAPIIEITPIYYDFGTTLVGCDASTTLTISNTGNVDLNIYNVQYYITYPPDLSIDLNIADNGPFPWVIAPNSSKTVTLYYEPLDSMLDTGFIEVHSDDPLMPYAQADQEAMGDYTELQEEIFEQQDVGSVDILFVIDNSGSMGAHQTHMKDNFDRFINVFSVSGVDYQLVFITTDSYDLVGPVISSTTMDPITEVNDQIDSIGTRGSSTERGIYYSYMAIQSGYPAGPGSEFWRDDAKLVIIYVSDEDDGTTTGATPTSIYTYVIGAKGGASNVVAHAVAGDYPYGCNGYGGSATAGDQYYILVGYLGGSFLSICQEDWGTPMESLANDSILKNSFSLSDTPIEETIIVEIDGITSTDWVYDATQNLIYFSNNPPVSHSIISIQYSVMAECEEKDMTDTGS